MRTYEEFLSGPIKSFLLSGAQPVKRVEELSQIGPSGGLESEASFAFLLELYQAVVPRLNQVLEQRRLDREFIDQRTRALYAYNREWAYEVDDPSYQTVMGLEDGHGRVVLGPLQKDYWRTSGQAAIAPLPEFLKGPHVTLFGPPDSAKMCVNAMNAYHRKLPGEPPIVEKLLATHTSLPKWGADDEDSKTPIREDLIASGQNLTKCFSRDLRVEDGGKTYELRSEKLARPIKRFPGLAIPCAFLYHKATPLPLHLYDFALHLFENWHDAEALAFYVPKLENEEEAAYLKFMIETAETKLRRLHPEYVLGTVRLMLILENPRAVFRVHEMIDALHPYFAGASLGWHDYLASTARLFKEDGNYRIPVKADPDIVIKYIKASHELLANVVGRRGGIKIGGMYGILPLTNDLRSASFQHTIKGYIRDVVTQFKRNLDGFWVAHPDFVRIGLAMVEAWKIHRAGDSAPLTELISELLEPEHRREILDFAFRGDIESLDPSDPRYARSLIVADLKPSGKMSNSDPAEIRYNVFQSLQYLTDWLCGSGCVALPALVNGVPVRVMDDLATAERSRWEVWHEIRHGRVALEDFLRIAFEEMHFIRKDLSDQSKIVQVKWDTRTDKWYPVAFRLMLKLMTDAEPVEFASQLLLPFTMDAVRRSDDPWSLLQRVDPAKYALRREVNDFNFYFERCGHQAWAKAMAELCVPDFGMAERLIRAFERKDILEAAHFHGNIGEAKRSLDPAAAAEQSAVLNDDDSVRAELLRWGTDYSKKFGMKFLISARGRESADILEQIQTRLRNSLSEELDNARSALWEITRKRLELESNADLGARMASLRIKHRVKGLQVALLKPGAPIQSLAWGESQRGRSATPTSYFEVASLSKSVASAFAMEFFRHRGVSLQTSVNTLFATTSSSFRLRSAEGKDPRWADRVTVADLLRHTALNLHYVNGVPALDKMPRISEFLEGNSNYGYAPVRVIAEPGREFHYSGGGFLVLEHLIESLDGRNIVQLTRPFLDCLGMNDFTFDTTGASLVEAGEASVDVAHGFDEEDTVISGTRKMFPAFAAGALGTTASLARFLARLTEAFHDPAVDSPISHETAMRMLQGQDFGSRDFMGANMGLGIFTIEAGPNRFALHQGANDGFRCLFLHCYAGPDRGFGISICCNGEMHALFLIAEVAQEFLRTFSIQGVDMARNSFDFRHDKLKQEEIINRGLKDLLFAAFLPDLPEAIEGRSERHPWADWNRAVGARVVSCDNQRFARAENLLCPLQPIFDPELYGAQGKVMDSWESARHSPSESEDLVLELLHPAQIRFVSFSTQFHSGNHVPRVSLDAWDDLNSRWLEVVPPIEIAGHAELRVRAMKVTERPLTRYRVRTFPDGGLTRMGLFDERFPASEQRGFDAPASAKSVPFSLAISQPKKPLTLSFESTPIGVAARWQRLAAIGRKDIDVASAALGAKILSVSNQHYGPAEHVISPYPPLNMFDGFESARSRKAGHFEECEIQLACPVRLSRLEIDFRYFVNNNPRALKIDGFDGKLWHSLLSETEVKAFAGNALHVRIADSGVLERLRCRVIPDGGINRIRAYGEPVKGSK